jgi:hypothetical protein
MKLRMEHNDVTGVIKDETGVVRGLWYRDLERASNPQQLVAMVAMLAAKGEKIEQEDRMVLSTAAIGGIRVAPEPAGGGYAVMFSSANPARSSQRKWWQFWKR